MKEEDEGQPEQIKQESTQRPQEAIEEERYLSRYAQEHGLNFFYQWNGPDRFPTIRMTPMSPIERLMIEIITEPEKNETNV